jgi:hypothetical protein
VSSPRGAVWLTAPLHKARLTIVPVITQAKVNFQWYFIVEFPID